MKWFKITIETETEAVDVLTYLLEENGIEGAIIEDPNDPMFSDSFKGDWDYSEDTARQFNVDFAVVKVFIEASENINEKVENINDMLSNIKSNGLNIGSGKVSYEIVDDVEWKDKWKEYFKPFKIGNRVVIKPSWEDYKEEESDLVIEMDPGSAFGSGTHETTSMCVKLLEKTVSDSDIILDIGCGTGILGITAAKLGANKVIGVDISEDAIIATNENIDKNNVSDIMCVRLGNLTDVITEKANIVVANIMADIIIGMTPGIVDFIEKDGLYITSGIIDSKREDVFKSLEENNFEIMEHVNEGEWNAILAKYIG